MITYQDLEAARAEGDEAVRGLCLRVIGEHRRSEAYETAVIADEYDHRRNVTINEYVRRLYTLTGTPVEDYTASNSKIASNFFNRLNTQRVMYSLGSGVSFVDPFEAAEGAQDETKEMLGSHFDHDLVEVTYYACIHGRAYGFWNLDRMHVFPLTQFAPLHDERSGALRAGVRFWRLCEGKPLNVVLYEEDGYTEYVESGSGRLEESAPKRSYLTEVSVVPFDGVPMVTSEQNYGSLPVVEFFASRLKQSTLIGMREAIDSYDLVRSGFANDMQDCAEIYWLLENYGGMTDADLARFRDRLRTNHVAVADTSQGGSVRPYTQEVPYQSRQAYLAEIRNGIYEDFGALDVHAVQAGATNDHIDAAYQPMDENAADLEHWIGDGVRQVLALMGVEDTPIFHRDKISNQPEQAAMVLQEAPYLDHETVLRKLPNLTPDEVMAVLQRSEYEDAGRMGAGASGGEAGE